MVESVEPGAPAAPARAPTRLLLIRHGETAANAAGLSQGRRDVPLNETGLRQAAALAGAIARYAPAVVVASGARRSRQTAEPLVRSAGCPLAEDPRLAEMDQGELDGLSGPEMLERAPDFMRRWATEDPADLRMPGGETLREVQTRALAAAREWAGRHPGADVVLVSHNFTIRSLLCHALGVPLAAFRRFQVDLAALSVVEWHPPVQVGAADGWAVVTLNEVCHLPGG